MKSFSDHFWMIILILNYDAYQNPENYKTRKPNKGHNDGHNEGITENAEKPCKQRPESLPSEHEGHDEGHDDAQNRGTLYNKKGQNKNDKTPEAFFSLFTAEENNLIQQVIEAIALTRKKGKLSESIKTGF
jgi:hypothetical protein